jgi:putative transposase
LTTRDNALAESVIGLFNTELIRRRGPWRTVEHVEAATLHCVDWFNQHRLLEANADPPPIELEQGALPVKPPLNGIP